MKVIKKSELIIERERTVTLKSDSVASGKFCGECAGGVRFVTIDEAAILYGTTSRHIFQLIENDDVHSDETDEGLLLVCPTSLVSSINF